MKILKKNFIPVLVIQSVNTALGRHLYETPPFQIHDPGLEGSQLRPKIKLKMYSTNSPVYQTIYIKRLGYLWIICLVPFIFYSLFHFKAVSNTESQFKSALEYLYKIYFPSFEMKNLVFNLKLQNCASFARNSTWKPYKIITRYCYYLDISRWFMVIRHVFRDTYLFIYE